jgi:hypothetical protein
MNGGIVDILKAFPAIWAMVGLIVGGGMMFIVAQKFGPIRNQAQKELMEYYQQQVKAASDLTKIQAEQHMAALDMQKEHWKEELAKCEKSRDEYKTNLHAVRNELGAECQELKLTVQELRLRPTVEGLETQQQAFYKEMIALMLGISKTLKEHDEQVPIRMQALQQPILDACRDISEGMNGLSTTLQNQARPAKQRKRAA